MTDTPTTTTEAQISAKVAELLPDDLLTEIDGRTQGYDRDNSFFTEDFEQLRATGFLDIALPAEFGGHGLGLDGVSTALRRLAWASPATAVATNMHIYWTGVAADLLRNGDDSCRFLLEQAAEGKVLAAIHGEPGNDVPLFLSTTTATKVDGGWTLDGHKYFGSLSPVWDLAGFHAMDASDPDNPVIVHGFVTKDTDGVEIVDTWDTLGMRATQSHDTVLHGAFCPDSLVARVNAPGFAGADLFHVGIFAWALLGFASVYDGAARRAFELAVEGAHQKTSIALTRSMAHHPGVQHNISEMRMKLDANEALLDKLTADWANGVEHADWPVRLLVARHNIIGDSFDIVDRAMDLTGGAGAFKRNRMEQIFRDARMGRFHPGNTLLAHELIGKLCLGLDPDDPQRWG